MRDIPVGNGSLLVNFDDKYQIRDIYFPRVGQENHTEGAPFRFGVWADGEFSWIASGDWKRSLKYLPETLVTDVRLTNENLGLEIVSNDTVTSHDNIFLRRVRVKNLKNTKREIRIFLHHDFNISETNIGDTAFYDPDSLALIHYKKDRYFLINTEPRCDFFTTGRENSQLGQGTWLDAEDGELSGGAMTEGSVDSTIGVHGSLEPDGVFEFFYWIAAGTTKDEVISLNEHILERQPQKYLDYTENYWRVWVNKNETDFADLPPEIVDFYKRCLLIVRTQIDNGGAILAANDSDVVERSTDRYSYLWTRDGAFVANALDSAKYPTVTRPFYFLCSKIVHEDGYFLQRYNTDGTVASGWHAAWDVHGKKRLVPIQEDETALVIWALWRHYDKSRDIEFVHHLYRHLVVKCADFMVGFRHKDLDLPAPSWNLWEDRRGIHTFTCATVVAGLRAAANFARLFGEADRAQLYDETADKTVEAMREHLYSAEHGRFLRGLLFSNDDHFEKDATVDASLFGVFYFDCFAPDDEMVANTMRAVEEKLWVNDEIGGIARYENDNYMRVSQDFTGNAWFTCTLWLAEYYIAKADLSEPPASAGALNSDLQKALDILKWTVNRALPSGVLGEQINPLTGEQVSVSPLTWSHSTFVATVLNYLQKLSLFSEKT